MAIIFCLLMALAVPEPPAHALPWGADDFVQYYVALELLLEGKAPYDLELAIPRQISYGRTRGVKMFAPPWTLLPSLLVIGLPFPLATEGYLILNVALMVFCVVCWTLLLCRGRLLCIPIALIVLFLWWPFVSLMYCGQNSLWPLAGFTGWLWFTTRNRPIPAGFFLALTIIKPHLGLMPGLFAGVYSLRQRHWATLLTFGISFATATLITFLLRPSVWAEYLTSFRTGLSPSSCHTYTLNGTLCTYLSPSSTYISYTLYAAALLFMVIRTWKSFKPNSIQVPDAKQQDLLIAWSVIVCMMVLPFVTYAWNFDFVFMLPGLILAIGLWIGNKRGGRLSVVVWIITDLWFRLFSYEEGFWIVPWMELIMTIWLLRERLAPDVITEMTA